VYRDVLCFGVMVTWIVVGIELDGERFGSGQSLIP